MRSWLVVAADDADALEQSAVSGADAVVIDLDREMGASQREDARERAREWLGSHRLQVVEGRHFTRRSEEHTSELQSLMRISYAVFCLKKKIETTTLQHTSID